MQTSLREVEGRLSLENLTPCPRKILYPPLPCLRPYLSSHGLRLASPSLANFVFEFYLSNYICPVSLLRSFISPACFFPAPPASLPPTCTRRIAQVNTQGRLPLVLLVPSVSHGGGRNRCLASAAGSDRRRRHPHGNGIPMHKYARGGAAPPCTSLRSSEPHSLGHHQPRDPPP